MSKPGPLVSCLCVTKGRVPLLRRAVSCFLDQTYEDKELVVVFDEDDLATEAYVNTLDEPSIRSVKAPISPRLKLGELRNLSIASSKGYYLAQWDDDDWYSPERLAEQIGAIESTGIPSCVLSRWVIHDAERKLSYLSFSHIWEGSVVCARSCLPEYPNLERGEDTIVIWKMVGDGNVYLLDRPELYIYVFHGENTWDRDHLENGVIDPGQSNLMSQLLSEDENAQVESLLDLSHY